MEFTIDGLINDRYELIERLRPGGMSFVFKAWDLQDQHSVVVKIATGSNLVARLKYEAMALKRLSSPRIVRLLDCGDLDDSFFIVLEYIDGVDLAAYLDQVGILAVDTCLSVGIDILEGLKAMHEKGFIHRDIKPGNLMVTHIGIKIIDFGIVKFISPAGRRMKRLTSPGFMLGTPICLSPEQAFGYPDLDVRADIYACGAVLYMCLAGTIPFHDTVVENLAPVRFSDASLRHFSEIYPPRNISEKVQAIVYKALKADRDSRYQTAEEMRMALLAELGSYTKIYVP